VPLRARGDAVARRRLYAPRMSDRTYAALARLARAELRAGRGVILDATFGSRERRDDLRRGFDRAGVEYCFVEARAPAATIGRRLAARAHSRTEISDARLDDWPALDRALAAPRENAAGHLVRVKTAPPREAGAPTG